MPLRHRGGRCRGVILQTPSGAVLASLIVNPGDAIIVIPTGRQTPLDGDDDGPQVSNHHCHTARTSTVLPGQRRKNRQAAAGRTVRRHSATAAIDGDPDRPPRRPRATRRKGKELISRVRAGRCELCEQRAEMHVHHVRALADLTQPGRPQPAWAQLMAKRRRKTLVVCRPRHDRTSTHPIDHHVAGPLSVDPDEFFGPFGDARACGKIGCGRSPRSVLLGAVSPYLSLIRGADGGAAHCCYEHEGPTLFHPCSVPAGDRLL